jgi:hypothetical protein
MVNAEIQAAIKREHQRIARLGGLARTGSMTAKERKELALKASRAAARARKRKAAQRKKESA